jgi:hypothetical protein
MERLYARQQNSVSQQDTTKAKQREKSQDGPQTLDEIPEESDRDVPTEPTCGSKDTGKMPRAPRIPEEGGDKSYFDLREDKLSPALSIVQLLDSDSDSDSSEEEDADVDSENDVDGSHGDANS